MLCLDEIGIKYGTDKSSRAHNFLNAYEEILNKKHINTVLEIGIYRGESLRMWEEYFSKSMIYGIDIDISTLINENRIKSFYGDQSKPGTILALLKENNIHPDLIIDDGSHIWSHQIKTYNTLFDYLNSGGIYIAEDLHTSNYGEPYKDCNESPLDYFSALSNCKIIYNSKDDITGIIEKC